MLVLSMMGELDNLLRCEEDAVASVTESSSRKGPSLVCCGPSLGDGQCLGE